MNNNQCQNGDAKTCSVGAALKCIVPAFIVAFAVIFGWEFFFHGHYMMDAYKATASMWRPEAEMEQYCWVSMVRNAVTAGIIVCLFGWLRCKSSGCGCPVQMGLKFGFKIGLLLGVAAFGCYAYMPIPLEMAVNWLVGEVIKGLLVGLALGILCKIKEGKGTPAA